MKLSLPYSWPRTESPRRQTGELRLQVLEEVSAAQTGTHPQRDVFLRAVGQGDALQADVTNARCEDGREVAALLRRTV